MDKLEFIQKAPSYYALAICVALRETSGTIMRTRGDIDDRLNKETYLLSNDGLWRAAISLLEKQGAIEVVPDDFGPDLYRTGKNLKTWLERDADRSYPWAPKFRQGGKDWLKGTLQGVNVAYTRLEIGPDDFAIVAEHEWEPIPIHRNDPTFARAEEAIAEAAKIIEQDNGYAVNAPAERDYVVSNLKDFLRATKEQTETYVAKVKTLVLDPLARVAYRFGNASAGLAATAARQAVFDWLKTHVGKLLSLLLP